MSEIKPVHKAPKWQAPSMDDPVPELFKGWKEFEGMTDKIELVLTGDREPGVYVNGVKVKPICGESSPWGMGGWVQGGEATYGYPPADVRALDFRPDFDCCEPRELRAWYEALMAEVHEQDEADDRCPKCRGVNGWHREGCLESAGTE